MELVTILNQTLDSFKIPAICVNEHKYRHFSFFDLQLFPGCRISKLTAYSKEIGLALRAKSTPIIKVLPENGIVRLQVVTKEAEPIYLKDIYKNPPKGTLPFLLGETEEGVPFWVDMATNPHLLVAGATGSGKSNFLHLLIANALKRSDVKLFLADTKRVEFEKYRAPEYAQKVQHLAQDYDSTISMLKWLIDTMERRYETLAKVNLTSIENSYFSKYVLIIDEVADLMMLDKKKEFERLICRLAQKARAAGIYLVLATQRPSVDVLTGLIKANFPARLSCRVASKTDSQVILDSMGAEHLMRRGDALFKNLVHDFVRLQIALP